MHNENHLNLTYQWFKLRDATQFSIFYSANNKGNNHR